MDYSKELFICLVLCFISCKNKAELNISKYKTDLVYTEILIDDTIYRGMDNYGLLRFQYKLADSVKLSKNDYRAIFLCLDLINENEITINFKNCDSFSTNTTKVNDTINCPFNFKVKNDLNSGKYRFSGKIYDHIILSNPKDTTFIRKIEKEHFFNSSKDLFVK